MFLTSLSVAIAASPLRPYARTVLLAAIAALAGLTKINVGIFVGLATLAAVAPFGPGTSRILLALALAVMPPLLMARHLSAWAWPYALATSAGIFTGVATAPDLQVRVSSVRKGAALVGGALFPVVALCVYLLARHSTLAAIADGVLIRPIALADVYVNPFRVPPLPVALSVAVAAMAVLVRRRGSRVLVWLRPILPAIKIGSGLYVIFWLGLYKQEIVAFSAVVIFALLADIESMPRPQWFGRVFLASSAAFHACTAYPVAGGHMWWSTFQLIAAAIVCVWDGAAALRALVSRAAPFIRVAATALACAALVRYYLSTIPTEAIQGLYQAEVPLPFEGSTLVHTNGEQAAAYGWLVANLKGHCSGFVTLPGYGGLYTWSGIRPVTGFNLGAWMLILTDREQTATVERMQQTARPCAVYNPAHVPAWTSLPISDRPLAAYILGLAFVTKQADYQLRVPADRVDAWHFDYLLAGRMAFGPATPSYPGPRTALAPAPDASLRLWFRTRDAGVLVGMQAGRPPGPPSGWCPVLYLGQDGRLRGELWNGKVEPVASTGALNDGAWHYAALVSRADRQQLYVDSALVGEIAAARPTDWANTLQVGNGFTATWPAGNDTWFPFTGEVRDVVVAPRAWDAGAVLKDYVESADGDRSRLPIAH